MSIFNDMNKEVECKEVKLDGLQTKETKEINSDIGDLIRTCMSDNDLIQLIVKGTESADKWKYIQFLVEKRLELASSANIEITINGTQEVDIRDWDAKIEEYTNKILTQEQWSDVITNNPLMSKETKDHLLELNPAITESLVKDIDRVRYDKTRVK